MNVCFTYWISNLFKSTPGHFLDFLPWVLYVSFNVMVEGECWVTAIVVSINSISEVLNISSWKLMPDKDVFSKSKKVRHEIKLLKKLMPTLIYE